MRIRIAEEQWEPVYTLVNPKSNHGVEVTVPETKVERWQAVIEEFTRVQEEMQTLITKKKLIMKTEKLYCYVDETGQDTLGQVFIVAVAIAKDDRDEIVELLDTIEQETGKKATKWMKTAQVRRVEYMKRVLQSEHFRNRIFYSHSGGTQSYTKITLKTITSAVEAAKTSDHYKASVFIDGLSRYAWRKTSSELRRMGLFTEKVRGVTDESHPMIRLADAIAGLVREKGEEKAYAVELFDMGVKNGTLREV